MITLVLSTILLTVFFILGSFHLYWFFGGTWGVNKVIPTSSTETDLPSIPRVATLVVALGLYYFGLIYFQKSGLTAPFMGSWIIYCGCFFIPLLFGLRAIGEFKYVGFFKKVRNTEFANADTKIFSPLCLMIAIMGVILLMV